MKIHSRHRRYHVQSYKKGNVCYQSNRTSFVKIHSQHWHSASIFPFFIRFDIIGWAILFLSLQARGKPRRKEYPMHGKTKGKRMDGWSIYPIYIYIYIAKVFLSRASSPPLYADIKFLEWYHVLLFGCWKFVILRDLGESNLTNLLRIPQGA